MSFITEADRQDGRRRAAALLAWCLLAAASLWPGARAQVEPRGAGARLAGPGQRVALVIGNADYNAEIGRLRNPVNDATDVAAALRRLGFSLLGGKAHLNLGKRQMVELIREFGGRIRAGGVGLFYFAGHGVQVDRRNYLLPITDSLRFQEDAEFEAVEVDQILRDMEHAESALNILILDACRNNNLPRKAREVRGGLGEPQRKPSGVFIAFGARDGQTAAENPDGRNGLYTQELLRNLETPNLRIEDVFINTRREVKRLSNKRQEPIEYGSLDDVFYFRLDESAAARPATSLVTNPAAAKPNNRPQPDAQPDTGRVKKQRGATKKVLQFDINLDVCVASGRDVVCQLVVVNESSEDKQFSLCHADYRAKRRGLEVTRAWDNLGNDYALAESSIGSRRHTQSSYNQAVLAPRVPVNISLRFANVPEESVALTLLRLAVAEQTNMVRLSYAEFKNVPIER